MYADFLREYRIDLLTELLPASRFAWLLKNLSDGAAFRAALRNAPALDTVSAYAWLARQKERFDGNQE